MSIVEQIQELIAKYSTLPDAEWEVKSRQIEGEVVLQVHRSVDGTRYGVQVIEVVEGISAGGLEQIVRDIVLDSERALVGYVLSKQTKEQA